MKTIIENLENIKRANSNLTAADKERYPQMEAELNILIKHASEKVTFEKDFLKEFLRVATAMYFESGYTNCINLLKQQKNESIEEGDTK